MLLVIVGGHINQPAVCRHHSGPQVNSQPSLSLFCRPFGLNLKASFADLSGCWVALLLTHKFVPSIQSTSVVDVVDVVDLFSPGSGMYVALEVCSSSSEADA